MATTKTQAALFKERFCFLGTCHGLSPTDVRMCVPVPDLQIDRQLAESLIPCPPSRWCCGPSHFGARGPVEKTSPVLYPLRSWPTRVAVARSTTWSRRTCCMPPLLDPAAPMGTHQVPCAQDQPFQLILCHSPRSKSRWTGGADL